MLAIKKILVATDFSECSDAALAYARSLAAQFHARLHVLHAVEFFSAADVAGMGLYSAATPDLMDRLEEDARGRLNGLFSSGEREALQVTAAVMSAAPPALAIVDYARSEGVDLIVLGTHGRKGLSHLLLGSVAERVVREAPCPVLTVRLPKREAAARKLAAETSPGQLTT